MLKKKYQTQKTALANYDYTDIEEGTGVQVYYGAALKTNAATTYNLSSNKDYSALISTVKSAAGTTTLNFDSTVLNSPKIVRGTAYYSSSLYQEDATGDNVYLKVQLQKVDGASNVTDISSEIQSNVFSGSVKHGSILIPMPLTQTPLQKGDLIRLVVKMIKVGATGDCELTHDPMERDGTYLTSSTTAPEITTKLTVAIPFDLDL